MTVYIFRRANGWYPLELPNDKDARANAECNPGTIKVENALTGKIVWPKQEPYRKESIQ